MKFKIVTEKAGRLRLRMGQYVFSQQQGQGLSNLLLGISSVKQVEFCHVNGSILVLYEKKSAKTEVISTLKQLRLSDIPEETLLPETVAYQQEQGFQGSLALLMGKHYLSKWFLPTALKPWYHWWKAWGYLKQGISSLLFGKITVEVLDATAIGVSMFRKDYTTASSTMFLLQLSELMLEYSNLRAKNQLTKSLAVTTGNVWIVEGQEEREIPAENLAIGDVIRLRKGTMIPADGTIISGDGLINEATMTGEPLSVHKECGLSVFAGTLLEEGQLDMEVRSLGKNTRIAQIVDFIQSGESTKANIQGKAEHLADQIVPISFGLFFGTFLFTGNLTRALSVLMVDFSCAIKLTTPIAVISALKESAEHHILVKGGKYLELLSQVDTVVFDKTGTLTEAVPHVSKILTIHEDYSEHDILTIAACLEEHFPHSVAAAIVAEAAKRGLNHPEFHDKVEYIVAHGIVTSHNGIRSCIGSRHFIFEDENIPYPVEKGDWLQSEIDSDSPVYLAIGETLVGVLCIHDPPRPEAKQMIADLRLLGIKEVIMMTGDTESTAKHVATELNLDGFHASLLPDGKAKLIENLKANGKTVLMVGDGMNDAPGLSSANVSMTLAGSSDLAREVADITILSHDLREILVARRLSTALMEKIAHHYRMIVAFNSSLLLLGIFAVLTASQNAWLHNVSTLGFAGLSTKPLLTDKNEVISNETT